MAPADGKITVAFPTGHAYGMRTEDGLDLLMHIGMDTVELDGKYFTPKVAKGDTVKRGDIPAIKDAGYVLVTPLVITNAKKLTTAVRDAQTSGASVAAGDNLLQVGLKEKTSA